MGLVRVMALTALCFVASCSSAAPSANVPPAPAVAGGGVVSPQSKVDGRPTVLETRPVPASEGGTAGRIAVLQWMGSWRTVATFEVPVPGVLDAAEPGRPLLVRDVTGDGQDDFVVPLAAASTSPYTVVSSDGGRWRQVPFGNEGQVIVREPDDPSVRTFVTSTNLCTPFCAAGHYRRDQWKYSSRDRRFLLASSAICDRTGAAHWRCEPSTSPLTEGTPLASP